MNVRTDRGTELRRDLPRRITENAVAANYISDVAVGVDVNTIDVATNLVFLDYVVVTVKDQSNSEIVAVGRCGRVFRGSQAVSVVRVQPNSVVAAAGKSSSPARAALGADRVSYRSIPLDFAIGDRSQEYAAEAAIRDGNPTDLYPAL